MMLNFDLILPAGGHLADIKTLQLATHCNLYTLHCTIHTLHPLYTFYMHSTHITLHCRSSIATTVLSIEEPRDCLNIDEEEGEGDEQKWSKYEDN